jgi:hypothetical protein
MVRHKQHCLTFQGVSIVCKKVEKHTDQDGFIYSF